VLVLGVTYKRNVGDTRGSPAFAVVDPLLALGACVRAHDQHVTCPPFGERVPMVDLDAARLREADVVVLLTDHDDVDYELVGSAARHVLDTRRRWPPAGSVEHL
jgi:UDP-N-acetyl-D-glucosamine dehydrogenase